VIDTTAIGRPTSPAVAQRGVVSHGTPGVGNGTIATRAAASVAPTGWAVAA